DSIINMELTRKVLMLMMIHIRFTSPFFESNFSGYISKLSFTSVDKFQKESMAK
ncbi:unnamed protein product, partial [Sphagnum troendelagicum]